MSATSTHGSSSVARVRTRSSARQRNVESNRTLVLTTRPTVMSALSLIVDLSNWQEAFLPNVCGLFRATQTARVGERWAKPCREKITISCSAASGIPLEGERGYCFEIIRAMNHRSAIDLLARSAAAHRIASALPARPDDHTRRASIASKFLLLV
jgi:hypothetical protein